MSEYLMLTALHIAFGLACGFFIGKYHERRRAASSRYAKMKREFDKHAARVEEDIEAARKRSFYR